MIELGMAEDKQQDTLDVLAALGGGEEQSFARLATILDSLDALIYVVDLSSHEVLFFNQYGRNLWGHSSNSHCCDILQGGKQDQIIQQLVDSDGSPKGVYVWELQDKLNQRWYQCREQAVSWVDKRLVRMGIATDITELKQAEQKLLASHQKQERLAKIDELTQLKNRRAFLEQGQKMLDQAQRFGRPLSLIILDVDYFKSVNDKHGHAGGDQVLSRVARLLNNQTRDVDLVGRIGGEEFAIVLAETAGNNACMLAERLRCLLEQTSTTFGEFEIAVSASFGVACLVGEDSLESLMRRADEGLYKAKGEGRNRVHFIQAP
ncbi:sensor domain-containing diguanylate cyclase [Porticoccaceae bacterium LTM1]|nr:sensor domain-containing diguanylate cyclase [Porticoccaceae bacterium LTM1]